MTPAHQQSFAMAFNYWFKGNVLAVRAMLDLLEVVHLWDDLVDGDIENDVQSIEANDAAMRKAMIDLPSNPFWASNQTTLQPVFQCVYLQWKAANELENSGDANDDAKAYMLRASVYQMFHMTAMLCGGIDWAVEIGPQVYRLYDETILNFKVVQGGRTDA